MKWRVIFWGLITAGKLFSQSFSNNTQQAITYASPNHTPTVVAISVNGLPNSLDANFGLNGNGEFAINPC
jgi:hypothetical protein